MEHLGVLGGEERGPGRSGSMWSQPLLPSAVRLLSRGFLGALGWRDCAEVHFHPLQSSQSYLLSQIMCKPVSQRQTHNLREVPVWLSWAWLEEGLGCGPSCCPVGMESPPQPEWTPGVQEPVRP